MACIDTIVTLGFCPDDGASTSGLTLLQAPGISIKNMAAIANENYISGTELAMQKKALALVQLRNDFIGALQSNRVVTSLTNPVYPTSNFDTITSVGTYAGERGVYWHRATGYRGSLRKSYLKEIEVYPLASGDGVISIYYDLNGVTQVSQWDVTFVANEVNVFGAAELSGFPFEIPSYASAIKVLIDQTTIPFASAPITCLKGCDNSLPNECGWAEGWDGAAKVKSEGYGINLKFYCKCDYEQIICDLAPTFSGELIWLKWQIAIYEEHYKTNRFNNWVIYNREDIEKNILPDLQAQYARKWNQLMEGILGILKTYRDDCLDCRNSRWVVNL